MAHALLPISPASSTAAPSPLAARRIKLYHHIRRQTDRPATRYRETGLSSRRRRRRDQQGGGSVVTSWWLEIACVAVALGALISMFVLSAVYNGSRVPEWLHGVNLTSVIAVLSVIPKISLPVPPRPGCWV
ncbi:Uu.00g028860.m01.CDS01 [Anthostomella pinea]|uniref:Uu.00g028860.m01.CDS01 n=1 Tax=Anthostomella pinea TaxID=933095 RepID=A0AAI8V363_9PEZI|nr:Uu.00g028860.m01.CDS01 [Anthostomella pinea]